MSRMHGLSKQNSECLFKQCFDASMTENSALKFAIIIYSFLNIIKKINKQKKPNDSSRKCSNK